MSDIRLKKISIEPLESLVIHNGDIVMSNTTSSINKTTGTLVVNGGISINCVYNATSSTFGGGLTVGGGIGVAKDIYVDGNVTQTGIASAFSIKGTSNDRLYIGSVGSAQIYFSPDGVDKSFELLDGSGSFNYTAPSTSVTDAGVTFLGGISISNTADSTSSTSGGGLTVAGGGAFTKNIHVGQSITHSGLICRFPPNDDFQISLLTTGGNTNSITNIGETLVINANQGVSISSTSGSVSVSISDQTISEISSDVIVFNKQTIITNTIDATGLTSGGLVLSGGLVVSKTSGSIITAGSVTIGNTLSVQGTIGLDITNDSKNNKLVLYQSSGLLTADHLFTGLGIVSGSMRYQVASLDNNHVFYSGSGISTSDELLKINGGSGDVTFKGNTQRYMLIGGGSSSEAISLQGQNLASEASFDLFTKDGDAGDNNHLRLYSLGTPNSVVNSDHLALGYKTTSSNYSIYTSNSGSGLLRGLTLEGGAPNQLVLATTGQVIINSSMASTSLVSGALRIVGGVSINSTVDSTSSTAGGGLTVAGGIAIAKSMFIGNGITLGNEPVSINTTSSNLVISSNLDTGVVISGDGGSQSIKMFSIGDLTSVDTESVTLSVDSTKGVVITTSASGTGVSRPIEINTYNNTGQLFISTSGNIGIGTTNPTSDLTVSGDIIVTGISSIGTLILGGTPLVISNTINSASGTSSGSIVTLGGVYIEKDIVVTGVSTIGALFITSSGSSSIKTLGGMDVTKTLNVTQEFTSGAARMTGLTTGVLLISSTAQSTNPTTGAIVTFGGLGVGKSLNVRGTSTFNDTLSSNFNESIWYFKDTVDIIRMSIDKPAVSHNLTFSRYDASGSFIDTMIEISNTTGNVLVNHGISINGVTNVNNSTETSGLGTGSLVIQGGASIAKGVFVGGDTRFLSTTESSDTSSGALIVSGGMSVKKNLNVGGNITITGDLIVSGQTTNVNSTTVSISDNVVHLNSGPSGSRDAGLILERYQTVNDSGTGDVVNDLRFYADILPSQTGMTSVQIKLSSSASSVDDFYNGWYIKVTSGFSVNQVRKVIDYTGTTRIATISTTWTAQNPAISDTIQLYNKVYVGLVFNETSDSFQLGSTVVTPGDEAINISEYSALDVYNIGVLSSVVSSNASTGGMILSGGIGLKSTENSSSVTYGGTITSRGGASFAKDVYIGGELIVDGVNISVNTNDILKSVSFNAVNNQSSPVNITGFILSSGVYGADISLSIRLDATVDLYAHYNIRVVNKASLWEIAKEYTGDDTGIDFFITPSGQIQYTTPNYPGFVSLVFKYRMFVNE